MSVSQLRPLVARARVHFRPGPFTSPSQARHNRRAWVRSVLILGPRWVLWNGGRHVH